MNQNRIIIGIGGNLYSDNGLHPVEIGKQAINALKSKPIFIERKSSWYISDPVPMSDQPKYFNSVVIAKTSLNEIDILKFLHEIEKRFGRIRKNQNEARLIDLDLIDYSLKVIKNNDIIIPHPRAHLRKFVMEPLFEIEKNWVHPILNISVTEILNQLHSQKLEKFSK